MQMQAKRTYTYIPVQYIFPYITYLPVLVLWRLCWPKGTQSLGTRLNVTVREHARICMHACELEALFLGEVLCVFKVHTKTKTNGMQTQAKPKGIKKEKTACYYVWALNRYIAGHGFESRWSRNIFQVSFQPVKLIDITAIIKLHSSFIRCSYTIISYTCILIEKVMYML